MHFLTTCKRKYKKNLIYFQKKTDYLCNSVLFFIIKKGVIMMANTSTESAPRKKSELQKPLPKDTKAENNGESANDTKEPKSSDEVMKEMEQKAKAGSGTLKKAFARMEAAEEQIKHIRTTEIKEVLAELKRQGFPTVAVNKVRQIRRLEDDVRIQLEEDMCIIKDGLGMQLSMFEERAFTGKKVH